VTIFYFLSTVLSTLLLIGAIHAMLAGVWRRYPVLFAYICLTFTLSAPMSMAFLAGGATWTGVSRSAYWILSLSMQLCGVVLVLALLRRAGERRPGIVRMVAWLSLAFLAALGGSVSWHSDVLSAGHPNRWMTFVSRDVAIVSAGLNLLLWSVLLSSRRRDHTLLLVSAGLGLQCTIDAIGHALRFFPNELREAGNFIISAGSILTSYLWFRVFQPAAFRTLGRMRTAP
jgi:hypothetical protein